MTTDHDALRDAVTDTAQLCALLGIDYDPNDDPIDALYAAGERAADPDVVTARKARRDVTAAGIARYEASFDD